MLTPALFAFAHHVLAFLIVALLTVELVMLRGPLTREVALRLLRMDAVYGACAGLLILVGGLRVFYFEKGATYYFHSLPFILKLALFAIVGLLSIYPTRQFMRWRKQEVIELPDDVRRRMRLCIHLELTLLFIIMLCAALMARGVGYIG